MKFRGRVSIQSLVSNSIQANQSNASSKRYHLKLKVMKKARSLNLRNLLNKIRNWTNKNCSVRSVKEKMKKLVKISKRGPQKRFRFKR